MSLMLTFSQQHSIITTKRSSRHKQKQQSQFSYPKQAASCLVAAEARADGAEVVEAAEEAIAEGSAIAVGPASAEEVEAEDAAGMMLGLHQPCSSVVNRSHRQMRK